MDGMIPRGDKPQFDLLTENPVYKPFRYPWAYEAWLTQQRVHWLPEEVPLADDVKDWHKSITPAEQNLLTQIFRFFTQADVEVNNCYMKHYSQVFKPTEVLMMLSAFSNSETIHVASYSHLLDTIGMPEGEYTAFLKYKEMKDKYDYMQSFRVDSKHEIAKTLAAVRGVHRGAAAVRVLRDPAELPAPQQDEGHGPDRLVVLCGMRPCTACPSSGCSGRSSRRTRRSGRPSSSRRSPTSARRSWSMRTRSSTSPSSRARSRG